VTAPRWPRLLGDPRGRAVLVGVGAAAALLLALSPGDLAPAAVRAAAVAGGIGALVALSRSRARRGHPAAAIAVVETRPLGRDAGVALVEIGGRRLLLGFGPAGVRLLSEVGGREEGAR
jgi:flagellar protein FliO/FliZ